MSIRQQVEDARFLAAHGRHLGALTVLMLAIAASSRKYFPKESTKSIHSPKTLMGPAEAFKLFLGGRILQVLSGERAAADAGRSGIEVEFQKKFHSMEDVLYEFYRNGLIHEAEFPQGVEFAPAVLQGTVVTITNQSFNASFHVSNDRLVLQYGWIEILISVVEDARINGDEFGKEYFDLVEKPGVEAKPFSDEIIAKYETSEGRFDILKRVVTVLSPLAIEVLSDDGLSSRFAELIRSGRVHGGENYGLFLHDFTDRDGALKLKGILVIREIAAAYTLVQLRR